MEIEIPLIVKLLYFGSVTGPDPRLWPDEMKDDPATAIEWVEKADKLAKAGTTEATVIALYLLRLKEREAQLPQLNIQMNRFKDNF